MASITSLTGSGSSSSIYGSRNILSGLASGMDTEAMIENAVSAYKLKIATLQKSSTKVEWQQEAYRGIIDKMASFSDKYTSYTSATNLMSNSFFDSAVSVSSNGTYSEKISASGKSTSDVQILGVKQLATSATYTLSSVGSYVSSGTSIQGESVDLSKQHPISNISGSMTIHYGTDRSYTLDFSESELYSSVDELKKGIEEKLAEQNMTLSDGSLVKLSTRIGVRKTSDGTGVEFYDKAGAGNKTYISSATGDFKSFFGVNGVDEATSLTVGDAAMTDESSTIADYLNGKEFTFTLDGVSKKISLSGLDSNTTGEEVIVQLQERLDKAFGTGKVKLAENSTHDEKNFQLKFTVAAGSALTVGGSAADALGLKTEGNSTYLNTNRTLGELLGDSADWDSMRMEVDASDVSAKTADGVTTYKDAQGNAVGKDESTGKYYRIDDDGNYLYDFKVNDVSVGQFTKETALSTVMTKINSNSAAGVTVSFSKTTGQFMFKSTESGEGGRIEFGDGLAKQLFGDTANPASGAAYTAGQDAVLTMKVNGMEMEVSRSGNSFDVDGMTVNLKGTFGYEERQKMENGAAVVDANGDPVMESVLKADAADDAVSFTVNSDVDKIVDVIKSMVADYNVMAKEIKDAYSTLPLQNSKGKPYEPLTAEDSEGMSESAIEAYESKAKTGLLFGDRDLSTLYNQLRDAISMIGADQATMEKIGLTTSYANGLTTLTLDESKLRSALETDPDEVRDVFTRSVDAGASSDGLMQALKNPLDAYAKVSGTKGILVEKAGSALAPTSLYQNTLQSQLDDINEQIDKWEDKLTDKIDYYNSKFTQLEKLINEMNSQSSALAGLTGGY